MRNLAAIFFFGAALVALCGSSGVSSHARQVQFAPQAVKIINTPTDGPFVPVANDPQHPIYVVVESERASVRPSYEYKVDTFSPPVVNGADEKPMVDLSKLQPTFEAFLNNHPEWEVVTAPTSFVVGPNVVAFRRQK
jgi:hypothetical protein